MQQSLLKKLKTALKTKLRDVLGSSEINTTLARLDEQLSRKNALLRKMDAVTTCQQDMLYAYRYLLDREPEDISCVLNNNKSWRRLSYEFKQSEEYQTKTRDWRPPGHFYSPIPDVSDIRESESAYKTYLFESCKGVDLNERGQLNFLEKAQNFIREWPYGEGVTPPRKV